MITPKRISWALALTAVYGDLLKRSLPGTVALGLLYGIAAAILIVMWSSRTRVVGSTTLIARFAALLIACYVLQIWGGFDESLQIPVMAAAYVVLPLAYLIVIQASYRNFDLGQLALAVTVVMIPVHVVGAIQYFSDPTFLISTNYSVAGSKGIVGGVIARNFLSAEGSFFRFPALFASADRYAGVSMTQLILAPIILDQRKPSRMHKPLVYVAAGCAMLGLFVAGARSRFLITMIASIAGGLALLIGLRDVRTRVGVVAFAITAMIVLAGVSATGKGDAMVEAVADFPVARMITQTFAKGDVTTRVGEGLLLSVMPDESSIFGQGLGTVGGGRPGEFGIRVMWIEGGLFWTPLVLLLNAGIIIVLARRALATIWDGEAKYAPLTTAQVLAWIFGLLAGLSSTFELSQALLLFPAIAVSTMRRPPITTIRGSARTAGAHP